MPDLDTSWNKVRDKMPEFVTAARSCGATDIVLTSQSLLLQELAPTSSGWCYGLSMAYIIGRKLGQSPAAIIANGYQAAGLQRTQTLRTQSFAPATQGDTDDIARIGQWSGPIKLNNDYNHSQYQTEEELRGLKTKDWNLKFDQTFFRFAKAAEALVQVGNGYALICTPNHAMAAAIGTTYSFYDPSFGSATFSSAKQFQDFFVKWFDKDFIQKSYKGTRDGLKNAPPAKSLVLKLRTFVPG